MNSYANTYQPDAVSPPGETLAELLEECEMSQAELAARIGRPKQLISEIASGKKQITPETALQLERALGGSADFWNTREARYRESLERKDERVRLAERTEWLRKFPVRKMIELGWIGKRKDKVDQVRELLNYFGVSSPEQWDEFWGKRQLAFRKSDAFEVNLPALSAWLRRGEIVGREARCRPFDSRVFESSLAELRALTQKRDPAEFVPELQSICFRAGVAVAFVPELTGCRASGVTQWLSPEKALIQLSLRYKTDDHLWFTFFHEAAHILKHPKKKVFVEYAASPESVEEAEADRFAAELLIPRARLAPFARRPRLSKARIRAFAKELGVSPGIVVGRLQHEGLLPRTHCNDLKVRLAVHQSVSESSLGHPEPGSMTSSSIEMPRRDRLRRVVILSCNFARNLCYYRIGQRKEFRDLQEPLRNPTATFWRQVNNNFIDTCVMEWCKLFADPNARHHWQKIVSDPVQFESSLLGVLELDSASFRKEIEGFRRYRDKFLAHLDSEYVADIPHLDTAKRAVWFYHRHIIESEAQAGDLSGLQTDLNKGYRECEAEAKTLYSSSLAATRKQTSN